MKPSSALILDQNGIVLLHRSKQGWRLIGQADPNSAGINEEMRYLRKTAVDLSGGQFATKLIIPNAQILYRELEIGDIDGPDRAAAVRDGLQGLTPYHVDELAFDWRASGDGCVKVAAVAEETLGEAEKFAEKHRFNPLSFVAIPEPTDFNGEPYFGEASSARKLLNAGGWVEPDNDAIDIHKLLESLEIPAADGAVGDQAAANIPAELADAPRSLAASDNDAKTDAPDTTEPAGAPGFVSVRGDVPETEPDPLQLKWVTPKLSTRAIPDTEGSGEDGEDIAARLATARVGDAALTIEPAAPETDAPEDTIDVSAGTEASQTRTAAPVLGSARALQSVHSGIALTGRRVVSGLAAVKPSLSARPVPFSKPGVKIGQATFMLGLAAVAAIVLALAAGFWFLGGRTPDESNPFADVPLDALPTAAQIAENVAQPLIPDQGGDPQGLASASPVADTLVNSSTPPVQETMQIASADSLGANIDEPALGLDTLYGVDAPEITASGIRQLAPTSPVEPASDRVDKLYFASIDRIILSHDAVALPSISGALPDTGIATQSLPPSFDQQFSFDPNGLVTATRDGALTPEGILVFAGSPRVLPTPRPGSGVVLTAAVLTPQRRAELAALRPTPRPSNLAESDERARLAGLSRVELGAFRPMPRPASLAQVPVAQPLAAPTAPAVLVSRRPVPRPSNLAKAIAAAVQSASAATQSAAPRPVLGGTVAQAATIQGGLRLTTINLIGVYGTSSSRRALVRLGGGRFVMVSKGDRLDGGNVVAISETSLVYVKNGRNVTLEIPNG